jgi:hypothetical protein
MGCQVPSFWDEVSDQNVFGLGNGIVNSTQENLLNMKNYYAQVYDGPANLITSNVEYMEDKC